MPGARPSYAAERSRGARLGHRDCHGQDQHTDRDPRARARTRCRGPSAARSKPWCWPTTRRSARVQEIPLEVDLLQYAGAMASTPVVSCKVARGSPVAPSTAPTSCRAATVARKREQHVRLSRRARPRFYCAQHARGWAKAGLGSKVTRHAAEVTAWWLWRGQGGARADTDFLGLVLLWDPRAPRCPMPSDATRPPASASSIDHAATVRRRRGSWPRYRYRRARVLHGENQPLSPAS